MVEIHEDIHETITETGTPNHIKEKKNWEDSNTSTQVSYIMQSQGNHEMGKAKDIWIEVKSTPQVHISMLT